MLQTAVGPLANATPLLDFEGLAGTAIPPDPNGAVGAYQFVETVNYAFGVFRKNTGQPQYSAVHNTLFQGFQGDGGLCASNTGGDAVVLYDHLADRWIITYMRGANQQLQCFAVSTSENATGSWYRYAFQLSNFLDYPKLGVWPDAYYMSFNLPNGTAAVALRRDAMLTGGASSPQCFQLSIGNVFPSDLDGATLPPTGAPNYFMTTTTTTTLSMYRFYVDFATPANSRLTGPIDITVAPYLLPFPGSIPQAGTDQKLHPRGAVVLHRVAYRNLGAHQSLMVTHEARATGDHVGMRWYELRNLNGNPPDVEQQGTFSPDSTDRWVGSIAMDALGDIALGYSVSSLTIHPGIRYTGRVPTNPTPGTLEAESTVQLNNQGSQNDPSGRWGDYTSMSVDPVFDCSFWYTNEYYQTSGAQWNTHIASFRFPSCVGCVGDCNRNKQVTIDELVKMINIRLNLQPITNCLRGDGEGDGRIQCYEVNQGTNNALYDCPTGGSGASAAPATLAAVDGTDSAAALTTTINQAIGSASGTRGSNITIPVTVTGGGGIVSATDLDLLYPNAILINPTCAKDPRLTNHSLSWSLPTGPPPPAGKKRLSTMIADLGSVSTFTDGRTFTCTFTISASAPSGTYSITGEYQVGSDSPGNKIVSTVTSGSVTVF